MQIFSKKVFLPKEEGKKMKKNLINTIVVCIIKKKVVILRKFNQNQI